MDLNSAFTGKLDFHLFRCYSLSGLEPGYLTADECKLVDLVLRKTVISYLKC